MNEEKVPNTDQKLPKLWPNAESGHPAESKILDPRRRHPKENYLFRQLGQLLQPRIKFEKVTVGHDLYLTTIFNTLPLQLWIASLSDKLKS